MDVVEWATPEKPPGPPRPLWDDPPDFLYAVLRGRSPAWLSKVMQCLHLCVTLLPEENPYWGEHWLPVCLPDPQLLDVAEGFKALSTAPLDNPLVVASMRVAVMIGFFADPRITRCIMVPDTRIHQHLQTRAPDRFRAWEFRAPHHGRNRTLGYVPAVRDMLLRPRPEPQQCEIWTIELAQTLAPLYCMGVM